MRAEKTMKNIVVVVIVFGLSASSGFVVAKTAHLILNNGRALANVGGIWKHRHHDRNILFVLRSKRKLIYWERNCYFFCKESIFLQLERFVYILNDFTKNLIKLNLFYQPNYLIVGEAPKTFTFFCSFYNFFHRNKFKRKAEVICKHLCPF